MYIILAYTTYVLLVVIVSAMVFGLCVAELIVKEAFGIVPRTVARIVRRVQLRTL